jgi:hypothetical protein
MVMLDLGTSVEFLKRKLSLARRIINSLILKMKLLIGVAKEFACDPRKLRAAILAVLTIFFLAVMWKYRREILVLMFFSDPRLDLGLNLVGGVLVAFIGILGGHVGTENRVYRWLFYTAGIGLAFVFVLSGIRNYRASLSVETPSQIVSEANQHTDLQIGAIRNALKESTEHSDLQVQTVRNDLKATTDKIGSMVSESTAEIGKSIASVRLEPPNPAKITFGFFDDDADKFPIISRELTPDDSGNVTIEFIARNASEVQATRTEIWIIICDACVYVTEPEGFDKPPGSTEYTRHRLIGDINPDVFFQKTSIHVRMVSNIYNRFDTSFIYSCANCGAMKTRQTIRAILPNRGFTFKPFKPFKP